ncbi:MAG: MGMT family protein, partial [Steroidobacteraceae bacterium]
HRVIGANGSLTGFGGGLEIKRKLLALEARIRRPGARETGQLRLLDL